MHKDIDDTIRVYVGVDRSQLLAVPVLEYSIKRHTRAKVEVIPMLDLPVPVPKDPRNSQRTGFSFSRFCIPKLAGYKGKAIYMDADMLVFKDIEELWSLPFDGAKVIVQKEVKFAEHTTQKAGAPKKRKKQCAVMLLDCSRLNWDVEAIVQGLDDESYNYDQLMSELCILDESEVNYGVPFEWNSLEHYDKDTRLIHFTDVTTQPWTSCFNPNGELWFSEVRRMLKDKVLSKEDIKKDIELGYLRPSLMFDICNRNKLPKKFLPVVDKFNSARDKAKGYVAHREVQEAKRIRNKAIKAYEKKLQESQQRQVKSS
ncbi:glycosyl transferase [Pseudomonas oryzihabitans]|uniref:Glycosyl transferase n=1 Tax=Pseudomonas oryzihabitans TaxID=47885 RepID=A0A0U4WLC4_9PSED|nr:glycosyltransferase [Pseudomonas oryzihabitans]ALZ82813.1 glycosyl transferase [Pseudomonas oryzihabitans]